MGHRVRAPSLTPLTGGCLCGGVRKQRGAGRGSHAPALRTHHTWGLSFIAARHSSMIA